LSDTEIEQQSCQRLLYARWFKRVGYFVLFFVLESATFAIIPLSSSVSITTLLVIHASIVAALLTVAILLRISERGRQYFQVFYAFFAAGTAVLLSTLFSGSLVELLGFSLATPPGIAVAKFSEAVLRVVPLLILMVLGGADRGSMYLNRGRIGVGLVIGIVAFIVFPILAYVPIAGQVGILDKLISLVPWILLFVLSNGFMEELLFRGLLLRRLESFLGANLSILLTALVFTLVHVQVTYVTNVSVFLLLIVFPLSLIWGYLTQKTDGIWGAVLFHAAGDCLIVFGAFASML
jgi:membrane protease YdiL (CAAX protease family)